MRRIIIIPTPSIVSRTVFIANLAILVGGFVVAGFAARRAIEQPILAQPDINLTLAEAAILLTIALFLDHLALHADVLLPGPGGAHELTLPLSCQDS